MLSAARGGEQTNEATRLGWGAGVGPLQRASLNREARRAPKPAPVLASSEWLPSCGGAGRYLSYKVAAMPNLAIDAELLGSDYGDCIVVARGLEPLAISDVARAI